MKKTVLLVMFFSQLAWHSAWAGDAKQVFDERVRQARTLERSNADVREYMVHFLIPALESEPVKSGVNRCIKIADTSDYEVTFVADIKKDKFVAIDVQPISKTADCIVDAMQKVKVSSPPPAKWKDGLPVFIHWNLRDKSKN